jgi:hypothetical protein
MVVAYRIVWSSLLDAVTREQGSRMRELDESKRRAQP